jgi:hypothetical protein
MKKKNFGRGSFGFCESLAMNLDKIELAFFIPKLRKIKNFVFNYNCHRSPNPTHDHAPTTKM